MIYYIADPHFGHSNIITLCNRPFEDIGQMDKTIINNWNARVRPDDTVYVLGDVAYKCSTEEVEDILKKLNGHKHLLVGNHDEWMNQIDDGDYFETIDNMAEINDSGRRCVLCHYPMLSWDHENKAYMIYGHIHSDAVNDLWPYTSRKMMLNAGVEFNNYMPVTLNELIANNARAWRKTAAGIICSVIKALPAVLRFPSQTAVCTGKCSALRTLSLTKVIRWVNWNAISARWWIYTWKNETDRISM